GLQLTRAGLLEQIEHLLSVRRGELPAPQPADEVDHGRPLRTVIEGGPKLGEQYPAMMRRAETVVPIDDADAFETSQALDDVVRWEGSEPLESSEAHLVALLAQAAHDDATRHRNRALTDKHVIRVVGHVLLDEWLALAAGQLVVLLVRLADDLG